MIDYSYIRYAVCWSPVRDSALSTFGVNWTGWCPETGERPDRRGHGWMAHARADVPVAVKNRGLIANIRSPFRLAEGRSRWALERGLDSVVRNTPEIDMPHMVPALSGGQVVMVPYRTPQSLVRLIEQVADMVRLFQAVPAPASPRAELLAGDDLAPRDSGQPAVETFHMPLTGQMERRQAQRLADKIGPMVAPLFADAGPIGAIDLMGDPGEGRPWRLVDRYRFAADTALWGIAPMPTGMACPDVPPVAQVSGSTWNTVIA